MRSSDPGDTGRSRAPEVDLERRRPRTPMAVRIVTAAPPEPTPSTAEQVLTSPRGERTVEMIDLTPRTFERPEPTPAPVERRLAPREPATPSEPPPPAPATVAAPHPDEPPPLVAEATPRRTRRPRVDVDVEGPSTATELVAEVLEHAEPVAGENPVPDYPWRARIRRQEGTCTLLVDVTPEGRAASVRIESGSGHGIRDEAAMAAVRRWRFVPARGLTGAVADTVRVPITFRLRD